MGGRGEDHHSLGVLVTEGGWAVGWSCGHRWNWGWENNTQGALGD